MIYEIVQPDDGSRNALIEFIRNRDDNVRNMIQVLTRESQYWKARVFLELLWEYERLKAGAAPPHTGETKEGGE